MTNDQTPDDTERLRQRYLDRLGLDAADVDGLRAGSDEAFARLVDAHVGSIPFENARVVAGERIRTDRLAAVRRIVDDGAGGLCYELNGALSWLLDALGLTTRLWAAEVLQTQQGEPERWGITGGHAFIEARTAHGERLVDVGFGGEGITGALPDARGRVTTSTRRVYRAEGPVDAITAFAPAAAWQSTSPEAKFTRSLIVSRAMGPVTRTLAGTPVDRDRIEAGDERMRALEFTAIVTNADGTRERRTMSHADAERFAREELGYADAVPTHLVVAHETTAAPIPDAAHRTAPATA